MVSAFGRQTLNEGTIQITDTNTNDYAINTLWNGHEKLSDVHSTNLQYLRDNAQGRIRNYVPHFGMMLYRLAKPAKTRKTSKASKKPRKVVAQSKLITDVVFRSQILPLIEDVDELARAPGAKDLHGDYFARGEPEAICDPAGLFQCRCNPTGGCRLNFSINPYHTEAEQRIFEAWEFDHIITQAGLARYVFDNATEVYNSNGKMKFDPEYFYDKLCTKENLRLVFKGCHDKDSRDDSLVIKRAEAIITLP